MRLAFKRIEVAPHVPGGGVPVRGPKFLDPFIEHFYGCHVRVAIGYRPAVNAPDLCESLDDLGGTSFIDYLGLRSCPSSISASAQIQF